MLAAIGLRLQVSPARASQSAAALKPRGAWPEAVRRGERAARNVRAIFRAFLFSARRLRPQFSSSLLLLVLLLVVARNVRKHIEKYIKRAKQRIKGNNSQSSQLSAISFLLNSPRKQKRNWLCFDWRFVVVFVVFAFLCPQSKQQMKQAKRKQISSL